LLFYTLFAFYSALDQKWLQKLFEKQAISHQSAQREIVNRTSDNHSFVQGRKKELFFTTTKVFFSEDAPVVFTAH